MGKYFIYGVIILVALTVLNWFKIIDVPLLDLPDYTGTKQEMTSKGHDAVKQVE